MPNLFDLIKLAQQQKQMPQTGLHATDPVPTQYQNVGQVVPMSPDAGLHATDPVPTERLNANEVPQEQTISPEQLKLLALKKLGGY